MDKHTATPWAVNPAQAQIDEMHGLTPVCRMLWPTDIRSESETLANAERIVAAVNAVEGIPTEALEAGFVREAIALIANEWPRMSASEWTDRRNTLLAKLRGDTDRNDARAVEGVPTRELKGGVVQELEAVLKCTLGVLEHRKIDWLTTDGPLQEKCRSVLAKLRGDTNG